MSGVWCARGLAKPRQIANMTRTAQQTIEQGSFQGRYGIALSVGRNPTSKMGPRHLYALVNHGHCAKARNFKWATCLFSKIAVSEMDILRQLWPGAAAVPRRDRGTYGPATIIADSMRLAQKEKSPPAIRNMDRCYRRGSRRRMAQDGPMACGFLTR